MKKPRELESLLTDVFSADVPGSDHDALLQTTLRHVRRKRWRKRATAPALAAAMLGLTLWFNRPSPSGESAMITEAAPPVTIIGTQNFPASLQTETRAGLIPVATTTPGLVALVETRFSPRVWSLIDDQELLALLDGHPALLIKNESGQTELIFPNRSDRERFFAP